MPAIVDEEKCIKCGACESLCPHNAITFKPGEVPLIDESRCHDCDDCGDVCPNNALTLA